MSSFGESLDESLQQFLQCLCTREEVLECLENFEAEVQERSQGFHEQCLDRLHEDGLAELAGPVFEHYVLVFSAIDRLREGLSEGGDEDDLKQSMLQVTGLLAQIEEAGPALRQWYEAQPKLSQSPLLDELLRVGAACLQEKLPWEAFLFRLEFFQEVYLNFRESYFEEEQNLGLWGLSREEREQLEQTLNLMQDSLAALQFHVDQDLSENVGAMLEELKSVSEGLWSVQECAQRRFEQPFHGITSCPRCSHDNPRSQRHCLSCGAILPRDPSQSIQGDMDIHSDRPRRGVPEKLAELSASLQGVIQGTTAANSFQDQVTLLLRQCEQVGQKLKLLKHEEALCQSRELVAQTQAKFVKTLGEMLQLAEQGRWSEIDPHIEELVGTGAWAAQLEENARDLRLQLQGADT